MAFVASVEVESSPSEAFELFADIEGWSAWAPAVIERRKLTEGPLGVGTRYHAVDQFLLKRIEFALEITRYDPPHEIAGAWSDPVAGGWVAEFDEVAAGTNVTLQASMRFQGALSIVGSLATPWARRQMMKDLETFKSIAESKTPA